MPKCDWSGEEFTGIGYVLQTTEGPQIVSAEAFFDGVPQWWEREKTARAEHARLVAEAEAQAAGDAPAESPELAELRAQLQAATARAEAAESAQADVKTEDAPAKTARTAKTA